MLKTYRLGPAEQFRWGQRAKPPRRCEEESSEPAARDTFHHTSIALPTIEDSLFTPVA
jgi:hypothetical protein